jgi:phage portal protein BeeE
MRECSALNMALTDPDAAAVTKLDAIEKWLQALGWLAPDELRAAMEKSNDRA